MSPATHSQMATFIWSICNLLRGPYKRNEYRKVILPLTVLRRFDCILAPTKQAVLRMAEKNILYEVVKAFADPKIDLSPQRIDNMQMGTSSNN